MPRRSFRYVPAFETLEERLVLSFNPAQIRHAYGFDQIAFNGVPGDGRNQTIAIIDAYDEPNIASDLAAFDSNFGIAAPPSFTKVNQSGGTTYPAGDTGWGLEISLDVEWAHAIAPAANILLVEANSNSFSDLFAAINYAKTVVGVSAVSMSWGSGEYGTETGTDGYFVTPAGHTGITFVASTGDSGSSGAPEYPSVSKNVLAVGGTQLTLDGSGNYLSETGWSGSGGGISAYEVQPTYQTGVVTQSSTQRTVPDVAYNGSSNSTVAVYDTYGYGGWISVYGTSAGSPQWAGLIAIADQGRVAAGQGTLDGPSQTLPKLYQLPQSDFHDITSGSNGGFSAGPGYDLVTGRGSPIANLLVPALIDGSSQPGNQAPTVATPAGATPSPVTGTTTNLSVLGADDAGESNLTYTWSVSSAPSGAPVPTFSVNGTNAAKNTTATFYAAGNYTFNVTITDSGGLTVTSSTTVTVQQKVTSVGVTPGSATLATNGAQQFQATARDQFGNAMSTQPSFTWSMTGIGTLSGTGMYTAPSSTGSATVQATGGGLSGSASVTVTGVPAAPTNLKATAVSNHQVTLSWQESSTNQTSFIIQRSTNGHNWSQIGTVGGTTTTYQDNTVSGGKTYYYRVAASSSAGTSGWSNTATVVTPHLGVVQGPGTSHDSPGLGSGTVAPVTSTAPRTGDFAGPGMTVVLAAASPATVRQAETVWSAAGAPQSSSDAVFALLRSVAESATSSSSFWLQLRLDGGGDEAASDAATAGDGFWAEYDGSGRDVSAVS
jgi:subtilase family serine protease